MILNLNEKQLARKQASVNKKAERLMAELYDLEETYRAQGNDDFADRCNWAYLHLRELPNML